MKHGYANQEDEEGNDPATILVLPLVDRLAQAEDRISKLERLMQELIAEVRLLAYTHTHTPPFSYTSLPIQNREAQVTIKGLTKELNAVKAILRKQ